jgi:hypothetical protein
MKAQAASRTADNGEIPARQLASDDATDRIPLGEALGEDRHVGEAADFFDDVPTLANRARPATEDDTVRVLSAPPQSKSAGAYRLVHPTTPDVIEPEAPPKVEAPAAKRIVLGATRKRH